MDGREGDSLNELLYSMGGWVGGLGGGGGGGGESHTLSLFFSLRTSHILNSSQAGDNGAVLGEFVGAEGQGGGAHNLNGNGDGGDEEDDLVGEVGGWVGFGWEEEKGVRMSYCELGVRWEDGGEGNEI